MSFHQCFMCREYSAEAISRMGTIGVCLCMECWNDVAQESFRKFREVRDGKTERIEEARRGRPAKSVPLLTPLT